MSGEKSGVRLAMLFALAGFTALSCSGERTATDDGDRGRGGDSAATGGGSGGTESGGSGGGSVGGSKSAGGTTNEAGAPGSGGTSPDDGGDGNATGGSGGSSAQGGSETTGGAGGSGGDVGGSGGSNTGGSSGGSSGSGGTGGSSGGGGTPTCGNGLVESGETCDDSNTTSNDGCSDRCSVESGYSCAAATCNGSVCTYALPVTFRDFNAHAQANGHPDFEPNYYSPGSTQGLVAEMLDSERKPVLLAAHTEAYLHGPSEFAEWYRESSRSVAIPGFVVLHGGIGVTFVNRWGAAGEQWHGAQMWGNVVFGGPGTAGGQPGCVEAACAGRTCYDPCTPFGTSVTSACCADDTTTWYEGTPLFFPIDTAAGILTETRYEGRVPEQYGWNGWPLESDVAETLGIVTPIETAMAPFPSPTHNFNFTSEMTIWVRYDADINQFIEIDGDDDIWVFFNGRLGIDLGGFHTPLGGSMVFSGDTVTISEAYDSTGQNPPAQRTVPTSTFGVADGGVYPISIFHAERQREGSAFRLALQGYDLEKSVCWDPP